MKQRDNFYFYFSFISLLFIFILIYYFYEMNYKLSNFLDIKTVLTVFGTVFGAYFGAKLAGKYAVKSVEKQIEANDLKERNYEKKKLMMAAMIYKARMGAIKKFVDASYPMLVLPEGHFFNLSESIGIIRTHVKKELETLKEVDISGILSEDFFILLSCLEDMKQIVNILNELFSSMESNDEQMYPIHLKIYEDLITNLNEDINMLNGLVETK